MGKDMKIKQGISPPPPKIWGDFFLKNALHGGDKLFWANLWGMFYIGTNDQIVQGEGKVSQIFQKSEHCKSENFPRPVYRIMEGFILEVNG